MVNGYDAEDLNQRGGNGDTALIKASRQSILPVVKELINAGVDINGTNNDHNNTLWFACFGNHYDLINLLLDTKIDINN
jgi:ankyrin repeat protein